MHMPVLCTVHSGVNCAAGSGSRASSTHAQRTTVHTSLLLLPCMCSPATKLCAGQYAAQEESCCGCGCTQCRRQLGCQNINDSTAEFVRRLQDAQQAHSAALKALKDSPIDLAEAVTAHEVTVANLHMGFDTHQERVWENFEADWYCDA